MRHIVFRTAQCGQVRSVTTTAKQCALLLSCLPLVGCGPSETSRLVDQQILAKQVLTSQLKDPESAQFDGVRAYVISAPGEPTQYNFCGSLNAKNGFGGYSGKQRFSANTAIAVLEQGTADFDQIWGKFCTDANGGKTVWM